MTDFAPAYRAYVFTASGLDRNADGTVNLAGSTFLTPRDAAVHTDPFKVASISGIGTFQPYLDIPRGRRGQIDPLKRKTDTGQLTLSLLDHRTSTGNLTRWVTAFLGDAEGRDQLLGLPVYVEESTDGGSSWAGFFTGMIHKNNLRDRLHIGLVLRDNADDLEAPVFVTRPHSSIIYAGPASVLPNGLIDAYAAFTTEAQIPGTMRDWSITNVGSGRYIEVSHKAYAINDRDGQGLIITEALAGTAVPLFSRAGFDDLLENIRVRLTVVSGGATGEFRLEDARSSAGDTILGPLGTKRKDGRHFEVRALFITPVDSSDPQFLALPAAAAEVLFDLISIKPPTKSRPLLIDDVHPVQLMKDLLDGKFGRINLDGTVASSFPTDTAEFTTLIADDSFGTFRGQITEDDELNEWMEENLCLPYGLAYFLDGDGRAVPVDWRTPTSYAGLLTIGNADLNAKAGAPKWEDSIDRAIRELHLRHYLDIPLDPGQSIKDDPATFPPAPAIGISQDDLIIVPIPFGREEIPYRKPFVIRAFGFRYMGGDSNPETLVNQDRATVIQNRLLELARDLESAYGSGLRVAALPCRRTANTACLPGDLRIVDVDELPDPATNLRGGARVMRCIGLVEEGVTVRPRFMDLGENAVAVAPSLGTLALTSGKTKASVTLPVTLNGSSERVRLDIAITPTATGTRPAEASELWMNAAFLDTTGDAVVDGLPSGKRVWPRVRTDPDATQDAKIPSGWIYPTSPASVDLVAMTAPSAGGSNVLNGSETELDWTVGEADADVVVALDGDEVARLNPGSDFFLLRGTDASTAYAATVWHDDRRGGTSAVLTINFTSGGTPAVCPAPGGIDLLVGDRV